jgi:alkylation response protein AidB-like acyl-CoA dehydrogenase
VDLRFSAEDETFRGEVQDWLATHLTAEFAPPADALGSAGDARSYETRRAWELVLGEHGWIGLGWPAPYGRELPLARQVIFYEEYARAQAPDRVNHLGENLLAPTVISCGTDAQRDRFVTGIGSGQDLWCQGYSEPNAGSDLANVATKAVLDGDEWVITGQKVWTSYAHRADWCFVVARTDADAPKHRGLSYLLVPMKQDGVEVRPIVQLSATSEFNEVFFDGARTAAENIVGAPGDGWRVAMATLGFERGVATLGQQIGFAAELDGVIAVARRTGAIDDPIVADRLTQAWIELKVMRYTALRMLAVETPGAEASVSKLLWAPWHQRLGELAMAVQGADAIDVGATASDYDEMQRLFLFSRADTIYGGSNEIQRDILARRMLGLPRS